MKRRDFLIKSVLYAVGTTAFLTVYPTIAIHLATGLAPSEVLAAEVIKVYSVQEGEYVMTEKTVKSEDDWRKILTREQYRILRDKGTEQPFTGKYNKHYEKGIYQCAGCGLDLYSSEDKFDSGTGWPSFTAPVAPENIATKEDRSFFMRRTELLCARCDGHLGHVFNDGPEPTGKRHCINSASLVFVPEK